MPNWIGDLVMATPILKKLKEKYPEAQLTAMCKKPLGQLLENDPHVDEIFSFEKPSKVKRREQNRSIINKLAIGKYDLGILTTNSFSSAWWFWQGNVKNRLGFAKNLRSPLLSKAIAFPKNKDKQHLVLTYQKLLTPLGIEVAQEPPKLYLEEQEIAKAYRMLSKYGISKDHIIVGINPGAAYGQAKCWMPERFEKVARELSFSDPKIRVIFFGDNQSSSLVKSICRDLPKEVVNLSGLTTIKELMALIKVCTVFLTNDSGPMHMADALEVSLVALFGSTNDLATGPFRRGDVIHKRVSCSPCYKRVCPIDFRCMTSIKADEVLEKIYHHLKAK